ncbi:hypothetical protein, partial [Streptomyces sp. NPDC057052]|uniref:hypothetical protein n=1 Tax=Streptomyces sp. NPDC057052 TaxID=3346010 RepID=UPI00364001D8
MGTSLVDLLAGPAPGLLRALREALGLEPGGDPGPGAVALPAAEQVVDPIPGPRLPAHLAGAPVRVRRIMQSLGCPVFKVT